MTTLSNSSRSDRKKSKRTPSSMAGLATSAGEDGNVIPGVTTEARDGRVHVWIEPKFSVVSEGVIADGIALSLEGFEVRNDSFSSRRTHEIAVQLRLMIGDFVLEIPAAATYLSKSARKGDETSIFEFKHLSGSAAEALRRFIRAHLMGHVVTVDDLVRSQNSPTNLPRTRTRILGRASRSGNSIKKFIRTFFSLIIALAALILIGGFGSAIVVDRLTIVHSAFATVSAPMVTMTAPTSGQVLINGPAAGQYVASGDVLARMPNNNGAVFRSPCDCLISYATSDGSWLRSGDPIYELVHVTQEDMQVEMLVSLIDTARLFRGQDVYIRWPETGELFSGTITRITLSGTSQLSAGVPEALLDEGRYASILVATSEALDPQMVGQPLEAYVRTEIPFVRQVMLSLGLDRWLANDDELPGTSEPPVSTLPST